MVAARPSRETNDTPSAGTPIRRIRMDDDLWERLDEAVKRADPDDSRPALIRRLAHWHELDEQLPAPGFLVAVGLTCVG